MEFSEENKHPPWPGLVAGKLGQGHQKFSKNFLQNLAIGLEDGVQTIRHFYKHYMTLVSGDLEN